MNQIHTNKIYCYESDQITSDHIKGNPTDAYSARLKHGELKTSSEIKPQRTEWKCQFLELSQLSALKYNMETRLYTQFGSDKVAKSAIEGMGDSSIKFKAIVR